MLNRFDGNVVPFASEATLTNRTVFGAETQSDDIDDNLNADFKKGWEIVGLNDNPTREDFNAMGYTLGNLISYLYQNGVAEYNELQEYKTNSIAIASDGSIYQSLVDNNIGNALTDATKWICIASKNSIVNSIDELKTISNIEAVNALGYYTKGDGGGGLFYWDSTSTETDNGGTIIQATGVITGRWKRVFSGAVNVKWFGAKGDGVTDDTVAIASSLAISSHIVFPSPSVSYLMTSKLTTNGHHLEGVGSPCEFYGTATLAKSIIEFRGVVGDCILNTGSKSQYKNIWFRAKDWTTSCDGLFLERYIDAEGCMFTNFNGRGAYFTASESSGHSPYHSVFRNCQFLFNAKHGVAILNGANAVTFENCMARWNGSPLYGQQPTAAGEYDGLYINGVEDGLPTNPYPMEPESILVTGGDYSYNSRYGQNWEHVSSSCLLGGYLEGNLVSDIHFGSMFGCNILNPMTKEFPTFDIVQTDPNSAIRNLNNYPNHITIRGRNYGNGLFQAGSAPLSGYRTLMPSLVSIGSTNEVIIQPLSTGNIAVNSSFSSAFTFEQNVRMSAKSWTLGSEDTSSIGINYIDSPTGTTEGELFYYYKNAGAFGAFFVANGGGSSSTGTFLQAPKNSITGRSINAGGTINASGADYAEYEYTNGIKFEKGDILGFKEDGTLTNKYNEAIRFSIKSTNPSYVGGDTWGSENIIGEKPKYPFKKNDVFQEIETQDGKLENILIEKGYTDVEWESILLDYENEVKEFEARLEVERQKVDRIAYSGKVPVNIYGAVAGQYLIAIEKDGTIDGLLVNKSEMTFSQYQDAVGRVNKILDDGRAEVAVMIH